MNNTPHTSNDPIRHAINTWAPRCFDGSDRQQLVNDIKERVASTPPETVNDARLMLAAVSRLIADTITNGEAPDLDRLVTELGINRWAARTLRNGAKPSLVAVHKGKLARLIRVERGLPARIEIRGNGPAQHDVLDWENIVNELDGELLATFIAAVGSGLTCSNAIGATVRSDDTSAWVETTDGERREIVTALQPHALGVTGVLVHSDGWNQLRCRFGSQGFSEYSSKTTHAFLALQEPLSAHSIRNRHRLSRRYIDSALRQREECPEGDRRLLLR